MEEHFLQWHELKSDLHQIQKPPDFQERDIWWCRIGQNVGYEIFGKNDTFSRPVLILRKYSKETFFGLPMTSRRKNFPSFYPYNMRGKEGSILLDQGRVFDARRLLRHIGRVHPLEMQRLKDAFKTYLG